MEFARRPVPADPHHASREVDHRRVDQRRRPEDVAAVEGVQRRHERQHHRQVERAHPQRPPPVDQAGQEERAHRPEHVGGVGLAPVGLRLAAGQLPRHLRAGPDLVRLLGVVGDVHLGHLIAPGVVVHGPDAVIAQRGGVAHVRVLADPVPHLVLARRDHERLHRVEPRLAHSRRDVDVGDRPLRSSTVNAASTLCAPAGSSSTTQLCAGGRRRPPSGSRGCAGAASMPAAAPRRSRSRRAGSGGRRRGRSRGPPGRRPPPPPARRY